MGGIIHNKDAENPPKPPMLDSEDPKQVINNDLINPQFGGGLINAHTVNNIQKVVFQQTGSSNSQKTPSQFAKEIPPLLPYLANRKEQESQLGDVFLKFLKQDLPGHLVCIIHGDELQCHHSFLERIRKDSLLKWLEIDSRPPISYKSYQLEWPSKLKNLRELQNQLYKSLANAVFGSSFYSSQEINAYLNEYPEPVIVYTNLLTEDFQKQGFESLNKLLEFCHHLHEKITNQRLIVYISIKYKVKRKNPAKNLWIKWLFSFGRDFLKQYRCQQINKKVRQYLENLANSDLNHFHPLSITILPELEGINQGEVENWVRCEDTKQLVGEAKITGRNYRLPSEAEWEYGCRAGTSTPFYFGETITADLVNYNGNGIYASASKGRYRQETTPVGSFPPNTFGLYDMHGNVWEWCQDHWDESYNGAPRDGSAWLENNDNSYRALRGGSWELNSEVCRSANRIISSRVDLNYNIGFRVVCDSAAGTI